MGKIKNSIEDIKKYRFQYRKEVITIFLNQKE